MADVPKSPAPLSRDPVFLEQFARYGCAPEEREIITLSAGQPLFRAVLDELGRQADGQGTTACAFTGRGLKDALEDVRRALDQTQNRAAGNAWQSLKTRDGGVPLAQAQQAVVHELRSELLNLKPDEFLVLEGFMPKTFFIIDRVPAPEQLFAFTICSK